MSIKTFFSAILLFAVMSLSVILFSFSKEAKADNMLNRTLQVDNCDPSQYTYVNVLIGDVIWIFVYNCDGILIDEYPTS